MTTAHTELPLTAFGDTDGARGPVPAPLTTTSSMTLFGTLIWLGPLFTVVFVANAITLAAVATWGSLDESIWMAIGAAWQRWPIAASGFTMTVVFVPMFVTNGITRRRLGQSATVTMALVGALGAAVVTAGFAVESMVFDAEGWTHIMSEDGGRLISDIGLPTIFGTFALVNAAFFASGWLAATALRRLGWMLFIPFLVVALVPAAAVEFLLTNGFGPTQFGFLEPFDAPTLWVGVPVAIAVIAATILVSARWTRSVAVD
jgi:hypothetical protein